MSSSDEVDVQRLVDSLIGLTRLIEGRLDEAGYRGAHDLMFATREVILDLPDLVGAVVELSKLTDPDAIIARAREMAAAVAFGAAPHAIHHFSEVVELIDDLDPRPPATVEEEA